MRGGLAAAALLVLALPAALSADAVTLPAAASVVGIAPFFSDVRVFNTSYSASLDVTAVYRCFGCASPPTRPFTLGPRESRSFDDICVSLFSTPNSVGPVEFTTSAPAGSLIVTSRLYSPVPSGGSVGMFIPGVPASAAKPVTVLTGLANGSSRTNIGVYNPNAAAVTGRLRLFSGPTLLGTLSLPLGARTGTQVSNIYRALGADSVVTTNGVLTVESDNPANPLLTYAAMADNATQDPIFVLGAEDVPAPSGPPSGAITVSLTARQFRWDFQGAGVTGGTSFTARVGQTYQLQASDVDPPGTLDHGFSGVPALGISGLTLTAGGAPQTVTFTPTASQIGSHLFACNESGCGFGHANMIGSIQVAP